MADLEKLGLDKCRAQEAQRSGPRPRRVSIQQSPKIYGGKELSNYYKRLLLAGR